MCFSPLNSEEGPRTEVVEQIRKLTNQLKFQSSE